MKTSRDQKLLETLMLYMPLAHQLGLYNINNELGNIWFRYADPEQYRAITNKLKATEKDREQITAEFIEPLKRKLSDAGIVYKLKIRTKSAYSIYRKMQVQKVPFEGIYAQRHLDDRFHRGLQQHPHKLHLFRPIAESFLLPAGNGNSFLLRGSDSVSGRME